MASHVGRLARYRLGRGLRRRSVGFLTIVVLVGVLGGVALAAAAAARRTESSFPAFIASTVPSQLDVIPAPPNGTPNYSPALTARLSHLPGVIGLDTAIFLNAVPLSPSGRPDPSAFTTSGVSTVGPISRTFFAQDRPAVVAGRMSNPSRLDEVVMTADFARAHHLSVGSTVPVGFFTGAQEASPGFAAGAVRPYLKVDEHVVGLVVMNTDVVRDDIDRSSTVIFTPALTRRVLDSPLVANQGWSVYGFRLRDGAAGVPALEREVAARVVKGTFLLYHDYSLLSAAAQHAIAPQVIALALFALIAALALLLAALQAVGRLLQGGAEDRAVLRALGASPPMIAADAALAPLGAIALGTILAVAIAIALSPLSPIGPVRPVYPTPGVALDGPVLGLGSLAILVVLCGVTALAALRAVARRRADWGVGGPSRGSSSARAAAAAGLSLPVVEGVRLALSRGRGRTAVPVRSVLAGATLAVVILVTTLTFGASLQTLVARPALYGWNYHYLLASTFGLGDTPPPVERMLNHDPAIRAWTPVVFLEIEFDGRTVPTMFESNAAAVAPPQLSGHPVRAVNQVVLGPATLAALHKRVGDTVVASYTTGGHLRLRIVGTATLPAIGLSGSLHPSLGVGAVASSAIYGNTMNDGPACGFGTQAILVRNRSGVSAAAGLADGRRVVAAAHQVFARVPPNSPCSNDGFEVVTVQRPAEIVNYRTMGSTPALLGAVLALAAMGALAATLVASVRRRRRDLAVLKALGFTRRQLQATVAWQATVTMGVGVIIGVPGGVVLGRWLWTLFARAIYVVPQPSVPWGSVGLVVLGAMVFANVVAAVPGRVASTTPTALVLRAE